MRTDDKKKEERTKEIYRRGYDDALRGVTYKEGSSTITRADLILAYARGYADGVRVKAGFL